MQYVMACGPERDNRLHLGPVKTMAAFFARNYGRAALVATPFLSIGAALAVKDPHGFDQAAASWAVTIPMLGSIPLVNAISKRLNGALGVDEMLGESFITSRIKFYDRRANRFRASGDDERADKAQAKADKLRNTEFPAFSRLDADKRGSMNRRNANHDPQLPAPKAM